MASAGSDPFAQVSDDPFDNDPFDDDFRQFNEANFEPAPEIDSLRTFPPNYTSGGSSGSNAPYPHSIRSAFRSVSAPIGPPPISAPRSIGLAQQRQSEQAQQWRRQAEAGGPFQTTVRVVPDTVRVVPDTPTSHTPGAMRATPMPNAVLNNADVINSNLRDLLCQNPVTDVTSAIEAAKVGGNFGDYRSKAGLPWYSDYVPNQIKSAAALAGERAAAASTKSGYLPFTIHPIGADGVQGGSLDGVYNVKSLSEAGGLGKCGAAVSKNFYEKKIEI